MQPALPHDKRALPYGRPWAIQDVDTLAVLQDPLDLSCLDDDQVVPRFLDQYHDWITSTQLNRLKGLERFPHRGFSLGTSEAFDKFYLRHSQRRFRCFRGEYLYHKLAWRDWLSWSYLEDADLHENDAVVISMPFADLGSPHPSQPELLARCQELGVPVLMDCAFFGICRDIDFDFSAGCITDLTFSLSKAFPVAHARIGMRYSTVDHDDTMFVYDKLDYRSRVGASLGLRFLSRFGPDFICQRYSSAQISLCEELGVQPSPTVLFGLGGPEWHIYNRGLDTNRLSFHRQLPDRWSEIT